MVASSVSFQIFRFAGFGVYKFSLCKYRGGAGGTAGVEVGLLRV